MDKLRGHNIELKNGEWYYLDNGMPTISTWKSRCCGHCGKHNSKAGHDGCIGTLKNVMNACCGHGIEDEAYIQFADSIITGKNALIVIERIKKGKGKD